MMQLERALTDAHFDTRYGTEHRLWPASVHGADAVDTQPATPRVQRTWPGAPRRAGPAEPAAPRLQQVLSTSYEAGYRDGERAGYRGGWWLGWVTGMVIGACVTGFTIAAYLGATH